MQLSEFDYELPKEFIAQKPLEERDASRLMLVDRGEGSIENHRFFELPDLIPTDSVLVFNESRVIPARIRFPMGNGRAEILLVKKIDVDTADGNSDEMAGERWECMVRPGPRFTEGTEGVIRPEDEPEDTLPFQVESITPHGLRVIRFSPGAANADDTLALNDWLQKYGETPLPPYVKEGIDDPERYQTTFSKTKGSVAAPTAGLHFTPRVFEALEKKGVQTEFLTLHVGLGTFQPVKTENIEEHQMHAEAFTLSSETASRLNAARAEGKKIIAVGTTAVRVLESCADDKGVLQAGSGETDIFITPGYHWKFVDQLITNFHVPKSTLLMLVSAFAAPDDKTLKGRDLILKAYESAKKERYRFFSFGDAMWIR